MLETSSPKKSQLDIFSTPEKLLLLLALVLAILTAPTWAGLLLLFVQATGRTFYRIGQCVMQAIRYGKLFHFASWFSALYHGSIFFSVNGWVLWSSIPAVEQFARMNRADPDDVTSKKSTSLMGVLHDALSIIVCICVAGLGVQMLRLKQLFASGIWLHRLMLALSAQGVIGIRAALIVHFTQGEDGAPATDEQLRIAHSESIFRRIPSFSHRQRHWSRFAVLDCGWIAFSAIVIANYIPSQLIWPLLYLVVFGDRFARLHADYLNEVMQFVNAVRHELDSVRENSNSISRRLSDMWNNISGRGALPSSVPSLELFILHYGLFYYHGIWVPGIVMTMGQVMVTMASQLMSWQMLWGSIQVIIPALLFLLPIAVFAFLDAGNPSIIQQIIIKLCGRREAAVHRVRELFNQWMVVAMFYGAFAWFLPATVGTSATAGWITRWRAVLHRIIYWVFVKAAGDVLGVIFADRLRQTTRRAQWAETLEKSSGWAMVLTALTKRREFVSASIAHSVAQSIATVCRVTGLTWLWVNMVTGLRYIGVVSVLSWIGHFAHRWSIDVPFVWLLSMCSRRTLNLGLLYTAASILSFSVFRCVDVVVALPWQGINRKISRVTDPIWNMALIICSGVLCVAVLLSMLSLTHTTFGQLFSPSVLLSIAGYTLCMVLLIAFLLELNAAYQKYESSKYVENEDDTENLESQEQGPGYNDEQAHSGEFNHSDLEIPTAHPFRDNDSSIGPDQGPSAPPFESILGPTDTASRKDVAPSAPPLSLFDRYLNRNQSANNPAPSAPPLASERPRSRQDSDGETDYSSATDGEESYVVSAQDRERLRRLGTPSMYHHDHVATSENEAGDNRSGSGSLDHWFSGNMYSDDANSRRQDGGADNSLNNQPK